MPAIDIKWRGKNIGPFEYDGETKVSQMKELIFAASGVEPSNQKLFLKGRILKDEEVLEKVNPGGEGSLMLMGTPSSNIPSNSLVFASAPTMGIERPVEAQPQCLQPLGLLNLGNTCYLNATLQSLLSVDEVAQRLGENPNLSSRSPLLYSISKLKEQLDKGDTSIMPLSVLSNFHQRFPHMAQRDEQGMLAQQDAEECWSLLVNELCTIGPANASELFTGRLKTRISCVESGETTEAIEDFTKLNCHIGKDTADLLDGVKASLTETVIKHSDSLGKNAEFLKTSTVSSFPKVLTINFIRFFWKPKEQVKAKILKVPINRRLMVSHSLYKKVKFPTILDLSTLKDPEAPGDASVSSSYELISIITHIGRSADSGHYIAWSRKRGTWWKFDDEKVSPITEEDIKKLDGGGDWHIAYLCIYKQVSHLRPE